jgi:hypothetical protein
MPPNKVEGARQAPGAHAIVPGQFDRRLQPELRFSVRVMNMNVLALFLTREEVEAIATMAKNCWAHPLMLHRLGIVPNRRAA